MESRTKSKVSQGMIRLICQMHFGKEIQNIEVEELTDGCFNASYKVNLLDIGTCILLKVGPDIDADVMTYETDMMKGEVLNYRAMESISTLPIPKLIAEQMDHTMLGYRYLITTFIDGIPLNKAGEITKDQRMVINRTLAGYLAAVHRIHGTSFGYPALPRYDAQDSYDQVFKRFISMVLEDAKKKNVQMPMSDEALWEQIDPFIAELKVVDTPRLVHFDLWDGNIFVDKADVTKIRGIIDLERGFYGDPVADLVPLAFETDFNQADYFFEAYNEQAEVPMHYDRNLRARLILHRIYLFLIMVVECGYRDMDGSFEGQRTWACEGLKNLIEDLKNIEG